MISDDVQTAKSSAILWARLSEATSFIIIRDAKFRSFLDCLAIEAQLEALSRQKRNRRSQPSARSALILAAFGSVF